MIYFPLVCSIVTVACGAILYYIQRYEITNNNKFNRYKVPPNNILIKLKLFRYDNRFNYFLLIPYLIAWNLFFIILILYIIYWCGVVELEVFFVNKWVGLSLCILLVLYISYSGFIDALILHSYTFASPDFIMDSKQKDDKKD